jgi:menaquinone-9 beta-reductase
MQKSVFDIIIIGGGPAGSTAAIYLSLAGFSTALFEMKSFPRETLCGEFLSPEMINILCELGIMEKFLQLNPNPINFFSFYNNDERYLKVPLGFTAYGLKRGDFDLLLLNEAKRAGASVFQPAKVVSIKNESGIYSITYTSGGEEHSTHAPIILAAYGKQNYLDRILGRGFTQVKSKLNGIKFHIPNSLVKNINEHTIYLCSGDNIYCGINAVNEETITVCFLENRLNDNTPPRTKLKQFIKQNESISEFFINEIDYELERLPIYGCGNIYFGNKILAQDGIFFIGDAAHVIAPLAGDGIAMAMQTAKLISEIFSGSGKNPLSRNQTEKVFIREWNKLFRKRISLALLIQKIMLNNKLRKLSYPAIKLFPSALINLIRFTRNAA